MDIPSKKIPCSVSIITRGEGVLESIGALKDFAEIIICHGNPPQETQETLCQMEVT